MSKYNSHHEYVGCVTCEHYFHESEGEYGGGPYNWGCEKRPALGNLKSFPFKKIMPCHQVDFWLSEFAESFGKDGDCEFDKDGMPIFETSASVKKWLEETKDAE